MEKEVVGGDRITGPNREEEEDSRWESPVFVMVAKEERLIMEKRVGRGHS